jgi:ATP-dependent Lon protease
MYNNITLEKINLLINFQRNFKFLKKEVDMMNNKLTFFKDILISMLNNLSYCNNLKIFQDNDSSYISILDELKEIKDIINRFPDYLTIKYLNTKGFSNISLRLLKCELLILKYLNHIAPENLTYILKLMFNDTWINLFEKDDLEKIIFISRFIRPICLWDSKEHKEEINFKIENNESLKKASMITKDLIETLMGIKKSNNIENIGSIIIPDDSSNIPTFLKNITDIIETSPKKSTNKRNNHFTNSECICSLQFDKIKITKNINSVSLIEDKYGCYIYIRAKDRFLVLQGFFKDDLLNISSSIKYVKDKIEEHKIAFDYNILIVPKIFKDNYFKILSLRDLIVSTSYELIEDVKKKYNDFKILQGKPLISLINEFLLASKYRKIDILTLLLISNNDDKKLAFVLFDIFKSKDKKDNASDIYQSLHYTIRNLLDNTKIKVEKEETELTKLIDSDISYERRISMMKVDNNIKAKAMDKLKSIKNSFQGDSKAQHWLDGLLKIPFGIYKENEILSFKNNFLKKILANDNKKLFSDHEINNYITELKITDSSNDLIIEWEKYKVDKKEYLMNIRNVLDDAVFAHKEAKIQLERIFAQWINGEAKGAVLGIQGPPGIGKTCLAKNGLSKCLIDKEGKPRPFAFLPIGGSVNGSTLVGHNFTYVGSTWGCIVDMIISAECMNPIIFIDEIDKVSHTEQGKEIISILTHMTDSTQNDEFEDKYFAGVKINLSKALIIFSFNDPNLIDPILKDRITIIETHPLNMSEKLTIIKDYMLPEIYKDVGFNKDELIFNDELIKHLIETYTNEAGVRKIKEKLIEIVRDINLNRFYTNDFQIPYTISLDYIKKLFENHSKVRIKKIPLEPSIGLVNGLYASSNGGLGGITLIQVIKFPSDKILELNLTGQAGDVMKESVQYALKNAFRLLSEEEQNKIIEDAQNKKAFGLHIHCPDGATPKDGPSAGLAFTLAIYSVLSGKKIRNDVCMTGEIDLIGNAGIIGGLHAKLQGGKKAGCKIALIPNDNLDDLEKMRREGTSPEDDNFKVILISHINEILKYSLLSNINES